jgi:two-component sensor histidine kinase
MEVLAPEPISLTTDGRIIEAVEAITSTLSTTLDPAEGLRRTLQAAVECVDATGGSIWQHSPDTRQLVCRHVCGEKESELVGFRISDTEGIAGQVFQSGMARSDTNLAANPHHARRVDEQLHYETRSLVSIPICYPGGVPVGVIQLVNKRGGAFSPDDLTVLGIVARVCGMSMHNADLAQQALRTHALGYVAGFAHDIYNRIAILVTGVPTLETILKDVFAHVDATAPPEEVALMREDAFALLDYMAHDADLVFRYAQFIAQLARDLPLDTRFEESDLAETTEAQVMQLQRRAREMQVALKLEVEQPVLVTHDRLLVGSAVYNLVNNALPETQGGTVRIVVRQEEDAAVVEVRDTGRGMPAEMLNRILKGNATSTKPGGSGIGTMIVKRVAEIHRGTLEGESIEGVGTTFRIRLPLHQPVPERNALPGSPGRSHA